MRLEILRAVVEEMRCKFPKNPVWDIDESPKWRERFAVQSKFLSASELELLADVYERDENKEKIEDRRTARKLRALVKLSTSGGDLKIRNLESMVEAMKMALIEQPRHWVFVEDEVAGVMVPYLVTGIQFRPTREMHPAHIVFEAQALRRGRKVKFAKTIYRESLGPKGCNVGALFDTLGFYMETDEMVEEHEAMVGKAEELAESTGLQLVGRGRATIREDRWNTSTASLEGGSTNPKLVVDDKEDHGNDAGVTATDLWNKKHGSDGEQDDVYKLPVHPYLRVFSLGLHSFLEMHAKSVDKYVYEEGLEDKLVLSDDKRELIDMLVSSGGDSSRDIVMGKSGGVIIITSGPPGTGKTLTAEVYAEKVKRPLYVVQCSQLGTDPEKLESKLQTVLERAVRWEAVLLIDEADVYIHERGDNIIQNAVVGVFLRLLEYYSGVLFLTTNRDTIIDDAIISRCIAHVRYVLPEEQERVDLWRILSEQYGTPLDQPTCEELATVFRGISGRSVKQLVRLGKALAQSREVPLDVDIIKWVSRFQHIEEDAANGWDVSGTPDVPAGLFTAAQADVKTVLDVLDDALTLVGTKDIGKLVRFGYATDDGSKVGLIVSVMKADGRIQLKAGDKSTVVPMDGPNGYGGRAERFARWVVKKFLP